MEGNTHMDSATVRDRLLSLVCTMHRLLLPVYSSVYGSVAAPLSAQVRAQANTALRTRSHLRRPYSTHTLTVSCSSS